MYARAAPRAREVVADLSARGRYHFTSAELRSALGVSAAAARQALSRLAAKGAIASPARGFYVIVPPEYRRLGCLPAEQFVPALMELRKVPYYAALLSAAQYHGAAHHRPQAFQVILGRNRPAISWLGWLGCRRGPHSPRNRGSSGGAIHCRRVAGHAESSLAGGGQRQPLGGRRARGRRVTVPLTAGVGRFRRVAVGRSRACGPCPGCGRRIGGCRYGSGRREGWGAPRRYRRSRGRARRRI